MSESPSGGRRRLVGRVALSVAAPWLTLAALEGGLRVAGAGYPTAFFVPRRGQRGYVTNMKFGWRFFPPRVARWPSPQVLTVPKPPKAFRIFVLGESAAYGTPSDLYGFARILEVMLARRFPTLKIEVVNAAMTAINSHVVRVIAEDCARREPDLFLVYMGNNEVIGPYGSGSVFGPHLRPIALVRAHIALRSTRLAQLFFSLFDRRGDLWGRAPTWRGLAAFTEHRLAADDPRLERVYDHFRRNLEDICRAAERPGAPVLGCTVAVNLRDMPPFASLHRADLSERDRVAFDTAFRRALSALEDGRAREAVEGLRQCVALDAGHADAHFWLGRALRAAGGPPEEAAAHFVQARDLDALRFRADSRLNGIVREVFSRGGPARELVDIERCLCAKVQDPIAVPGDEFFYEHVHFTWEGNYEVARALFQAVEPRVAARHGLPPAPDFVMPSPAECAARLGYTLVEQYALDRFMLEDMIGQPPFTEQVGHSARYEYKARRLEEKYRGTLTPEARAAALAACEAKVREFPDDLYLRRSLVNHYLELGQHEAAIGPLTFLLEQMPSDYVLLTQLAGEHLRAGHEIEAERLFRRALALNPYYYVARHNLAVLRQRRAAPDIAPATNLLQPGRGT